MNSNVERKIGDRTYSCVKMPADQATFYAFRLGGLAAPLMENLNTLTGGSGDDGIFKAIGKFLTTLDPKESQGLIIELCQMAKVTARSSGAYEPVVFNATFSDNVLNAFKVAAFVIEVNFADFFAEITGGGLSAVTNSLQSVKQE